MISPSARTDEVTAVLAECTGVTYVAAPPGAIVAICCGNSALK